MAASILQQAYVISADADWEDSIPIWIGNIGTPDDLTGCSAKLWLRSSPGSGLTTELALDTADADGRLTVVENRIDIRVDKDDMNALPLGTYTLSVRLDHPSGYEEPLIFGPASIVPFGDRP